MNNDPTKICTKCNLPKSTERFRFRTRNGRTWQQGRCMDCEAKEQRDRNEKRRHTVDYKEKNKANARRYALNNPDKIKAYRVAKRLCSTNKEYSEYRKRYWANNEEQRLKHKTRAAKHYECKKENITDKYIIDILKQKHNFKDSDIPIELIELHRAYLTLKRLVISKQKINSNHEQNQNTREHQST